MGLRNRSLFTEEQFYFVTTTVKNFIPIFERTDFCDILLDNIKHYQKKYEFIILGYVIMPTHFHWIVKINPAKGTISDIMRDIKKYSAWDILEQLKLENSELIESLSTKVKPGQKSQMWMHRFDDEVIRNNKMFWVKLNYIHNNPVKAGLVNRAEDYKFSSARNYINNDHKVIVVDTSWGGINIT